MRLNGRTPKLSMVISIYNRLNQFSRSLFYILNQTLPKDLWEIVVVDDQSDDSQRIEFLLDKAKSLCPDFNYQYYRVKRKEKIFCISRIRNIGIRLAKGGIIGILDGETIPDRTTFDFLLHQHVSENLWVRGGYMYKGGIEVQKHIDLFPWQKDLSCLFAFASPPPSGWLGIFGSISKKTLIDIGGFDEDFKGWGFEDADLFHRIVGLLPSKVINRPGHYHIYHQHHLGEGNPEIGPAVTKELYKRNEEIYLKEKYKILKRNVGKDWGMDL